MFALHLANLGSWREHGQVMGFENPIDQHRNHQLSNPVTNSSQHAALIQTNPKLTTLLGDNEQDLQTSKEAQRLQRNSKLQAMLGDSENMATKSNTQSPKNKISDWISSIRKKKTKKKGNLDGLFDPDYKDYPVQKYYGLSNGAVDYPDAGGDRLRYGSLDCRIPSREMDYPVQRQTESHQYGSLDRRGRSQSNLTRWSGPPVEDLRFDPESQLPLQKMSRSLSDSDTPPSQLNQWQPSAERTSSYFNQWQPQTVEEFQLDMAELGEGQTLFSAASHAPHYPAEHHRANSDLKPTRPQPDSTSQGTKLNSTPLGPPPDVLPQHNTNTQGPTHRRDNSYSIFVNGSSQVPQNLTFRQIDGTLPHEGNKGLRPKEGNSA